MGWRLVQTRERPGAIFHSFLRMKSNIHVEAGPLWTVNTCDGRVLQAACSRRTRFKESHPGMPYRKRSPGTTYIRGYTSPWLLVLVAAGKTPQDLSDIEDNKVYLDNLFEFRVVVIKLESLLIRLGSYGYPGDLPVV